MGKTGLLTGGSLNQVNEGTRGMVAYVRLCLNVDNSDGAFKLWRDRERTTVWMWDTALLGVEHSLLFFA